MRALALLLGFLVAFPQGVFAFGGVVTDPSSYTYFVTMLQKMETQVQQGVNMINQQTKSADTLVSMKQQLEGAYNRAVGLPSRLLADIQSLQNVPTTLQQDEAMLKTNDGYVSSNYNLPGMPPVPDMRTASSGIDSIFGDPRDPNWSPWGKMANMRYETRQKVMKASIANAEIDLQKMPGRLKTLNDLAAQIDHTQNLKDATDLGNRFLLELLYGQEQMIQILAYMAQAAAIRDYKGVTQQTSATVGKSFQLHGSPTTTPTTTGGKSLHAQEQALYGSNNADAAISKLGF